MANALMLLGTHSNAGKSTLATALCRLLARRGYRVAPFKAQNMSNNAGVTPQRGEMGRAQIVQAEAAGVDPHTDMNPVLLKPEADGCSQIVLNGRAHSQIDAKNWRDIKPLLWDEVRAAYDRLALRYEVIVMEGAGSPAEINLKDADMVNLRMARHAGAPALLIGDIDRGGVFAALAGTMLLMEPQERAQIHAFIINKFRGDPALLGDALEQLRARAFGVPTLGVVPYVANLRIAEEDAVALEHEVKPEGEVEVDIVVVQLPHIANFDDFDALNAESGVRVRYVSDHLEIGNPQVLILPGSKTTITDLQWLHHKGWEEAIVRLRREGMQIVGVCGGYQMLGTDLVDPHGVEGEPGSRSRGLDLLSLETEFAREKQTHRVLLRLSSGEVLSGYEIHTGVTVLGEGVRRWGKIIERSGQPVDVEDGAIAEDGGVWGTYLHGLFNNHSFRRAWLKELGWSGGGDDWAWEGEYDRLAVR